MNIGIVGCGMVSREHLRALKRLKAVKVVALCDNNERTLTATSKEWGIKACYTDINKMLDSEKLNIVSILTPPQSHRPPAVEAIRRNVNVLVEKPLTMTSEDADLIMKSLQTSQAKLTVDYVILFSKVMRRVGHLVKSGQVGKVLGAEFNYLCTKDDPMASNQNHWCHQTPGGRLGEMLPHPIYVLQSLLGNELRIEKVDAAKFGDYGWIKNDELKVLVRGKEGWGDIYASFNAARPSITIDVYGTRMILKVDLINQTLLELDERSLSRLDSGLDSLRQSSALLRSTIVNTAEFIRTARMEGSLRSVYDSFVKSIETHTNPEITPEMAYETVKITEEICNLI
jgi:predicted dehydrogenase